MTKGVTNQEMRLRGKNIVPNHAETALLTHGKRLVALRRSNRPNFHGLPQKLFHFADGDFLAMEDAGSQGSLGCPVY